MYFCTNCGEKITENTSFCVNCGTAVEQDLLKKEENTISPEAINEKDIVTAEQTSVQSVQPQVRLQNPKKPLSLATKLIIGALVGIFIIGFGVRYYLGEKFDGKNQLLKMHEAYMAEDKETFYSYFEIPENTSGDADAFYEWISSEDWSTIRMQILEELVKSENGLGMDPIGITYEDALRITKEKALLGLFEKTVFNIRPLEVSVVTNLEGTSITIADKNIETAEKPKVLGNFIPGTYELNYEFEGPYMPITGTGEVDLISYSDYQLVEEIYIEHEEVELYSDYSEAIVYINDVSTKKTIEELDTLSPVVYSDDVKVHLVAMNSNGEEIVSNSYPLTTSYIDFEFEADKELALLESVKEFYQSFREDYSYAIQTLNFDYVAPYFPSETDIYKDYKKFIEDHAEIAGYNYDFISNEVTDIKRNSDNEFQLTATEEFDYYSDEDGTIGYVREKSYKISYKDDELSIVEIKDVDTKKTKK